MSLETELTAHNTVASRLAKLVVPDARSGAEILRDNFDLTLGLFADGVDMKRESLRRQSPDVSADEIEEALIRWLEDRPLDGPEPFFRRR